MKSKTIILLLLMAFSASMSAQIAKISKGTIGITYSALGVSDVNNWERATLAGAASYSGKSFYTVGVTYIHPIRSWLDIETGVEYSSHTIRTKPMQMPGENYIDAPDDKVSLINIPVTARINFLNHFFVNGGVLLDIETGGSSPIDSHNGLGAILGVGAKYSLDNGIGAFANLYTKFHSLVPFTAEFDSYRWRLIEGGLRVGLTYSF